MFKMLITAFMFILLRNMVLFAIGQTTAGDTTNNPKEVDAFYDKTLIQPLRSAWIYGKYGQKKSVQQNDMIRWKKYPVLGTQPIPLMEGVNPQPQKLESSKIEATVSLYGGYIELTEECEIYRIDPEVTIAQERASWQGVETIDEITRDNIHGGTNVLQAGAVAAITDIVTKVTDADLRKLARAMMIKKTPFFKDMIGAGTGVSTTAINNAWLMIISPQVLYDLENSVTGFVPVSKYPSQNGIEEYEMGSFGYFRMVVTTNAPVVDNGGGAVGTTGLASAGGTKVNVHKCLALGPDAFGVVDADGGIKTIRKDKKEVGGPLELYSTVGWKARYTAKILDDDRMYRYQCGVTA